jgi:lipid-A-disaccharide synthase
MVNLIAGKRIVPELIQGDFTAERVVSYLKPLLEDDQARLQMRASLRRVADMLRSEGSAIGRVAEVARQVLRPSTTFEERQSPVP